MVGQMLSIGGISSSGNLNAIRDGLAESVQRHLQASSGQSRVRQGTIDIDIALFNRDVICVDGCRIPDPDILTRPYLAVTLAELDAGYVHPETGTTLSEIAGRLSADATQMCVCPDVVLSAGTTC